MADQTMIILPDGGAQRIYKNLYKTPEYSLDIASGATEDTFTLKASALTHTIVFVLPTFTNTETGQVTITNGDGEEIYASASNLAKNTTHILPVEKPLVGTNTIKVKLTGTPGDAIVPKISIYLRG